MQVIALEFEGCHFPLSDTVLYHNAVEKKEEMRLGFLGYFDRN